MYISTDGQKKKKSRNTVFLKRN